MKHLLPGNNTGWAICSCLPLGSQCLGAPLKVRHSRAFFCATIKKSTGRLSERENNSPFRAQKVAFCQIRTLSPSGCTSLSLSLSLATSILCRRTMPSGARSCAHVVLGTMAHLQVLGLCENIFPPSREEKKQSDTRECRSLCVLIRCAKPTCVAC